MTDAEIIAALGGSVIVAAHCKVSRQNAHHWAAGKVAIPWRYREDIETLAKAKRVRLPKDFRRERRVARAAA